MAESGPSTPVPEVPGYRLLEPLGEGGMGIVYRAEQISLCRLVAIKFLHPLMVPFHPPTGDSSSMASSPPRYPVGRAIPRESLVLAQVNHPNIVTLYDSGTVDGREYLVLEYLSGGSLRERLTGTPWTAAQVLPILTGIADALNAIHERGLLHLDLKPENVLFDQDDRLKLTDFGLARWQMDAATLSELGMVRSSLDYSALEQRSGLQVDPRTDLFSLAVILYELLSGRVPGRVYRSILDENRTLSTEVDSVLARGLARHAEDRPATVQDFQQRLTDALNRSATEDWPIF